ncbi:putative wound-responsive family protein [Tanacetum coccineum]
MSSTSKAWMVAGTVGLVEALKDQGFARWNYTIRTIHHHTKANLRSVTHSKKMSTPAAMASCKGIEQSEESLRKPFYGDIKELKSYSLQVIVNVLQFLKMVVAPSAKLNVWHRCKAFRGSQDNAALQRNNPRVLQRPHHRQTSLCLTSSSRQGREAADTGQQAARRTDVKTINQPDNEHLVI